MASLYNMAVSASRRRAVFLDRDGVLIRDVNYLTHPDQVALYKGAGRAVADLRRAGFKVVVITNQSGVGRGYLTLATLSRVHARLRRELKKSGARLDGLYYCPHTPEDHCPCRKPSPKMLQWAARDLRLDLRRSYMIGDTTADISAARRAGCVPVLVRTGKGGRDGRVKARPRCARRDLASAARWILYTAPRG